MVGKTDALSLTGSATTAAASLGAGGAAAAKAMIAGATTAAGILAGQQTKDLVVTGAKIYATGGGSQAIPATAHGTIIEPMARGGKIDRGTSSTLATQGIIGTPTLMNATHLVGEGAAAEGVFPLRKTMGGKFGVEARFTDSMGNQSNTLLPTSVLSNGNLGVRIPENLTSGSGDSFTASQHGNVFTSGVIAASQSGNETRSNRTRGGRP